MVVKGRVLNYKFAKHDPRDYPYKHIMKLVKELPLPDEVDLTKKSYYPGVYDQGDQGSCTSQAGCGTKSFITRKYIPHQDDPSTDGFYYCEREANGDVGEDAGSDGRTSAEVMMNVGVGSSKIWGYSSKHLLQKPPPVYYADAAKNKIDAYYFLKSQYEMQRCLANGYPFVFGMFVPHQLMDDNFDGYLRDCKLSDIMMEDGNPAGHQLSCFGYKIINGRLYFLVRNSWGSDWALKGHFWIAADMMTNKNWIDDCITYRLAREPGM